MIALPLSCPVFIGRRDELDVLNDARRALGHSHGSVVLVGGEAGIGKSRMVAHFALRAGDGRVRNLASAECREGGVEPLRPFRDLLEALLASYVPENLPASAERVLGRFAPQSASAHGREAAVGAMDRADIYAGLAALFFAYAAKRATVLIIEDVHWSDPSSFDFLIYLAERLEKHRLLVVATHRTEGLDSELVAAFAQLTRLRSVRRIELDPFDDRELREFVAASLGDRATLGAAALESILVRSEGNAFYAEELLKSTLASGRRAQKPQLPISIRGAILRRLAAFDELERRVLSHAAVLGLRFDPLLLATILERDIDAVRPVLLRARDAALVCDDPERPVWLRFRHALTRQVIYDDLLAFDRQRLHARILEVLEDRSDSDGGLSFALAEHAAAAGDPARTLTYGERAGNAAWSLGAYTEAIACFERALAAATTDDDRARLLESLGYPVSCAGDASRAITLWTEAVAMYSGRGDYGRAVSLHQTILCERFNVGDRSDEGEAVLAFLAEHRDAVSVHSRDSSFVVVAAMRGEASHMDTIDDAMRLVEDVDGLIPSIRQNVYRTDLNRAAYIGDIAGWRDALARLTALSPLHENAAVHVVNVVDHLTSVVISGLSLGVNAEIEDALARGKAAAGELARRYLPYYDAIEAAYALTRGRLDVARSCFENARRDKQYLTRSVLARIAPFLALALDDDSFVEDALDGAAIERERAEIRAYPTAQFSRLLLGAYAVWLDQRGRVAEAETYLDEALGGVPFPSPRFVSLLALALRHLGSERVPHLETFADAERCSPDDRTSQATARLASGALARRRGDEATAAASFAEAAAAYDALGFTLDAAHAHHLAGNGAAAAAGYGRCGATTYARAVDAAHATVRASNGWPLSEREETVAQLVSLGLTNIGIAERMSVSHKTVEKHVSSIFRKLDVHSRAQVATRLVNRNRC